jgi:hypothetical protein
MAEQIKIMMVDGTMVQMTPAQVAEYYAAIAAVAQNGAVNVTQAQALQTPPTNGIRINPANRKPAEWVLACGTCAVMCLLPAACQCVDFDVPQHSRKFTTSGLAHHVKSQCYHRQIGKAQANAMAQTLMHNGYEIRETGATNPLRPAQGATLNHVELAAHVVPVPGGANRVTARGVPMCRATFQEGPKVGELCTYGINRDNGMCHKHTNPKYWQHLPAYVKDATLPPYDAADMPEVDAMPQGNGDEAAGAQTADTASDITSLKDALALITAQIANL